MDIFFKLHESKQLHRQIKILAYLRKRNEIISITELAQEIGCTPPTLRTDIQALRTKLPPTIKLLSIKMIGYQLKISDGETLDTFLLFLARETITYKLIDRSFRGSLQSFEAMRLEYHLSSSALRKIIRHMNLGLINYRIQFSPKNGDLLGKENDIRFFFFYFYMCFRRSIIADHTYIFSPATHKVMFAELQQAFQSHLHISNFRAMLWLSILKERWLRRKKGEIPENTLTTIQSRKSFKKFEKKIGPFLKKILGIQQLSTNELAWIYLIVLHCISYSSSQWRESTTRTALHYQEEAEMKSLIKQRLLEEPLIYGTNSEGIEQMSAYLANLHLLRNLTDQFEKYSLSINHLVDHRFQNLHLSWENRLIQWDWQELLPLTHTKEVALSLSLIQFSTQSQKETKKQQIIFAFHGDAGYDNFLITMIQKWLPKQYDAHFLIDQVVTQLKISELHASLVVSNYDLDGTLSCDVIQIAQVPTKEEWLFLQKQLIERSIHHSLF
ncbi:MAG: helix-turn-helix domain containing protein [Enterococcus mundtii]|nr:helix-turn-helix domain containing protein [Enterococcus mundtii]